MAKASAVWGIDVGQCALKALKLRRVGDDVAVEAFDIIEHEKILSQPDADRAQLIRASLEQFLARNPVRGAQVVASMPGLTSFPCFVKLPPVETRKIPDIVRFEAQQQIPLPLEEVVWQYQTFQDPDSPDIEVGIFAVRRTDVAAMLDQFAAVALPVDAIQMAPLALFNFMDYDGQRAEGGATLLVDVGADKTDLVVADPVRMWTRTIRIGGNNFTEALVRAFKLSFSKAEKLKRTAATSKYARQIFQAMRPVFADLVQEIQKSLGYFSSLHRETRLKKILALGGGFRLPGFQKYIEQNLNIPVARLDGYERLKSAGPADTPVFTENIMSFAVAYGLALQGLGLAAIETSLLPTEIARKRLWKAKRPWFAAAAAVLLAGLAWLAWRASAHLAAMEPGAAFTEAARIVEDLDRQRMAWHSHRDQGAGEKAQVQRVYGFYEYRNLVPAAHNMVDRCIAAVAPNQPRFGHTELDRTAEIVRLKSIPRPDRKMITVEFLDVSYVPDVRREIAVAKGAPAAPMPVGGVPVVATGEPNRGLKVILRGRTPLDRERANEMLVRMMRRSVEIASEPLEGDRSPIQVEHWSEAKFLESAKGTGAAAPLAPPPLVPGAAGPAPVPALTAIVPDPLMAWATSTMGSVQYDPGEDIAKDTRFEVVWILSIVHDGLAPLNPDQPAKAKDN